MSAPANWSPREDSRAYWEQRAQTFDLSPGHGTDDPVEIALWADLLRELGLAPGMQVLADRIETAGKRVCHHSKLSIFLIHCR